MSKQISETDQNRNLTTKNLIAQAMRLLIEEGDFKKITIYQILEKSGVSRRTFYRHFCNKNDLLDYCLDKFVEDYSDEKKKFFSAGKSEEVFVVTLRFMDKNRVFLSSLIRSGEYDLFTSKFNDNSISIYKNFGLPWNLADELENKDLNYISKGLIGSYLNILKFWLTEEDPYSPEAVARDITLLFNSIPNYFDDYTKNTKNI